MLTTKKKLNQDKSFEDLVQMLLLRQKEQEEDDVIERKRYWDKYFNTERRTRSKRQGG